MKAIRLARGELALVDDQDYERINAHLWHLGSRGYVTRSVYSQAKPSKVYMHREVLNAPEGVFVDHANGDKLDNTRANLRPCSNRQNQWNRRVVQGATPLKGVTWHAQAKKWQAQIRVNGRNLYLGLYDSATDAAVAYDTEARRHFGDFAFVNFEEKAAA